MGVLSLFFSFIFSPFIIIIVIAIVILLYIKRIYDYKKETYYQITKCPYNLAKHEKGRHGEYLIYKHLQFLESSGVKFLFNVYLPKENGETTEIDVLMISKKGLFVFESKNYGGWIFGSENQKNWCQTLYSDKQFFYNPILQNRSHIKHLKSFLGDDIPMWSMIVFSDRCTLKDIRTNSNDVSVIHRSDVANAVNNVFTRMPYDCLYDIRITDIYNKLYPYTQVDEKTKLQHINRIHNNINTNTVYQTNVSSASISSKVNSETFNSPSATNNFGQATDNKVSNENVGQTSTDNIGKMIMRCPRCNGVMVLKTAKTGSNAGRQFYGCSNYPKCNFILNIRDKKTL